MLKDKDDENLTKCEFIYCLLYLVLKEFVKTDYNGIIRQLMKLLLDAASVAIRTIIDLKEEQTLGYLLAIFETHIVDAKIKRDKFNLLQMRNIMISDEQAKKMNLDRSL